MAIVDNLDIDKHKTLISNRDKIIDLIFSEPKKYLDEELCNNDELTDDDIDRELIKNLNFKNLEINEIYYWEHIDEILVGEEDEKPEIGESNDKPVLEPVVEPSNVETYLDKRGIP